MSKLNWIIIGLVTLLAVASIAMMGDAEHAQKLAQAQRDASLSPGARDIVMGVLALSIGGYLAWYFLIRRDE